MELRGTFDATARRSTNIAVIRNALFVAVLLASMTIWAREGLAHDVAAATAMLGVEGFLLALAVWRLVVAIGRRRDVRRHPLFVELARHGDAFAVASEIEQAIASGAATVERNTIVTPRFVVLLGIFPEVVATSDVGWVYLRSTQHSVNFIPVGTVRSIIIHTFSKAHRHAPLSMSVSSKVLAHLTRVATRARFGFSDEKGRWWRSGDARREDEARAAPASP